MKIEKIRTIIADDNKGMLDLIKRILGLEKNIEVLAVTEDGNRELEWIYVKFLDTFFYEFIFFSSFA